MPLATLTTKGQLTIPKKIREGLNLHAGDKVEVIVTDDGYALLKPVSKKVDDLFCKLYKKDRIPICIEKLDQLLESNMKEYFT